MGVSYGPRITTKNLTWALDAKNSRSYSGTGSEWANIIGTGSNISLQNSPTWSSSGYFEFNGTTQYGSFVSPVSSGAPMTIEGWVLRLSDTGGNEFVLTSAANGHDNAFIIDGSIDQLSFAITESADVNNDVIYSGETLDLNKWVHFAGSIEGNRAAFWYNGNLVADNTYGFTIGHWYNTNWNVSRRTNGLNYCNCRISQLRAYERFLTDEEIKHNYLAHRGRYQ